MKTTAAAEARRQRADRLKRDKCMRGLMIRTVVLTGQNSR
jgi:hypothetical protein